MNNRRDRWVLYFAFLLLFVQSVISVAIFSQTIPDGGYWPFVLVITTGLNIFYSTFVLWLIQIGLSTPRYTALATLALALCIFLFHNFGWLFGQKGVAALAKIGMTDVLSRDSTLYALYAVFVVIPLLGKLRSTSVDAGH